jgi:hypothetical protein
MDIVPEVCNTMGGVGRAAPEIAFVELFGVVLE